jgi:putative endonuclease
MSSGWMYILECADGSYYTGSTTNLELRLAQHQAGEGANHTKKRLPVKLVYYEFFQRIQDAFYREKQVQGWSRKKKEALIRGKPELLKELARNYTQYPREANTVASAGNITVASAGNITVASAGNITVASAGNITVASASSATGEKNPLPEPVPLPEPAEGSGSPVEDSGKNKKTKAHE